MVNRLSLIFILPMITGLVNCAWHNIVSSVPQYWSILADETQDCSTCEQVSLCIRYVKENEVCEDFLGLSR